MNQIDLSGISDVGLENISKGHAGNYTIELRLDSEKGLLIFNTKMEHLARKPAVELASCPNCLKLVGTRNKKCPICNLGVNNWYQFKKIT